MGEFIQFLGQLVFFLANKPSSLRAIGEKINLAVTVEAEYGDECVEGSIITLAHHGPRKGNPPPCVTVIPASVRTALAHAMEKGLCAVGLSHLDLDTVGGILRIAGYKPFGLSKLFWEVAGQIDVRGVHHLNTILAELVQSPTERPCVNEQLYAYWAWSEDHKKFAPRDGSAENVTADILKTVHVLNDIFHENRDLIAAGDAFQKAGEQLNTLSYVDVFDSRYGLVVIRSSEKFVNHLYVLPDARAALAPLRMAVASVVLALNPERGCITVSKADETVPLNCKDFVQSLWGKEAGGHAGIAGSPRDAVFGQAELDAAITALRS